MFKPLFKDKILPFLSILGGIFSVLYIGNNILDFNFNDTVASSSLLHFYIKIFQNVVFSFLFFTMCFKYRLYYIGLLLPLAIVEQQYNLFYYINTYFLDSGFYNLISKHPLAISPEYPRVAFFFILLVFSLILLFFKKIRTSPRIFIFIGSLAIFTTSILFHTVILAEINFYKTRLNESIFANTENFSDKKYVDNYCTSNNLKCFVFNSSDDFNLNNEDVPDYLKKYNSFLSSHVKDKQYFKFSTTVYLENVPNRILGQIPLVVVKNPENVVLVVDQINFQKNLVLNQYVFGVLALFSHVVWFFGPVFLIYFHKKKLRARKEITVIEQKNNSIN